MFLLRWLRFDGRISLGRYWLTYVLPIGAAYILTIALDALLFGSSVLQQAPTIVPTARAAEATGYEYQVAFHANAPLTIGWFWLSLIPGFAGMTKRWHDRGRSGWWNALVLIPVIGWIWLFISLGCRDGQRGANRYGPDPITLAI
ncbi:DUF805 domain-containing protein [Roseomonas elaeocarpi]|uniref:DUF805 domain-containing protein n=1 Tax=Roseomonas elaeocarpi TaxID=907779 RepID=A0ABV6JUU3_9PROT